MRLYFTKSGEHDQGNSYPNLYTLVALRTKAAFDKWQKQTSFSLELLVPRTVCVMLNVVIQAKKQVNPV